MRVGYLRKMNWFILCVIAVLVSQGNGLTTSPQLRESLTPTSSAIVTTRKPTGNVTTPQLTRVVVTISQSTVNVTTRQPTINVTTPQPTVTVTTPQPTGNVTTPQPTGNGTTPQPTVNVTTQPTVNVTTPQPTVIVTSPQPTVNITTPQSTVIVITPQPTVNVTTPQSRVIVTTLQPTVIVTTLQPTVNVTTLQPTVIVTTLQPTVNVTTQPTANVTSPQPTVIVATPQPTVNVTTPQPTANVTTPQSTVNVTSFQSTVIVTSSQPTVNVTSPQSTVNVTTPQPTLNVTTPQPTVNVTSPQPTVIVTTPQSTGNVTTPQPTVNVTTRQPTVIVTTPQPTLNVTTPQSTVIVTTPQPTVIVTTPQSTVNVTTPQPTVIVTTPQSTVTVTTPQSTVNVTTPQSTVNVTTPQPTVIVTTPQSTVNVTTPQSTVIITTPQSTVNVTTPQSTVIVTTPRPTVIVTTPQPPINVTTFQPTVSVTTLAPTSPIATFVNKPTYCAYVMSIEIKKINRIDNENQPKTGDEERKQRCSTLIDECTDEYTENEVYRLECQEYLKKQMCGISAFTKTDCRLTITDLKCGSLITEYKLVLGVNGSDPRGISTGHAGDVIRDEIKNGSLGAFAVDATSFKVKTFVKNITEPKSTEEPPQAEPNVYVIVTMEYTWYEFCKIKEHFRETIAERSYNMKGEKLKTTDIFIVNSKRNCAKQDKTKEGIDVWFVALGSDADKVTIQIGNDLKDLLHSRQLTKLGNLFEDRITDVRFGGKLAPDSSGMSDNEKIWLAVGITLAILLAVLLIYLFSTRKRRQTRTDMERGPNYFAMDNIDGSKKEPTVLVNQGFDEQEAAHTPLTQRISTFKDAPKQEEPLVKAENDKVDLNKEPEDDSKPGPSDQVQEEGKKAPLGEGEDTDDELGMTVVDVAIEPEKNDKKPGATPPGTLPIIPPDPVHMAIQDTAKFTEDTGGDKRDKEYEDLDQTKTDPKTYPSNTLDKNRAANVVPKPETVVKLSDDNSYINANFVKDHHGVESFIATQHPMSNTMRDFWSLVWQHDISVIVMVNDSEKDLENFHNYWMDHQNSLTIYGHMQVKTESTESMGAFTVTKFVLKNSQESDATKVVRHFRFTNWPDKGIPDVKEFAQFIRSADKARLESPKSPIVVHCKDGQGYTGVAMAADIGLRVYNESDKKSMVNVFDCVNKMRGDRNGIVSSKDLYKYIFKVLKNITDSASTSDSKL